MSTIEFKLPALGEGVETGTVVKLLVKAGDAVTAKQPLMEVEVDKATVELEAPAAGTIASLKINEGDTVPVGALLLTIDPSGAPAPAKAAAPTKAVPAPAPAAAKPAPAPRPEPVATTASRGPASPGRTLPAGPAVRRLARMMGVDLGQVRGSGERGRITYEDVHAFVRALAHSGNGRVPTPALPDFSQWGPVDVRKVSTFRRRTAEAMFRSWEQVPHVTHNDLADITDLEAGRKAFRKKNPKGPKVTMTVLVAKACAVALQAHPEVNSTLDLAGGKQIFKSYYHVGIAVDTEYGLLVPVLKDVDKKSVLQLSVELTDLAVRTRDKKVKPAELKGATFTVSNLGGIGGTGFTPIVNWPQVAILGVSRGRQEYVVTPEGPSPRLLMPVSLSYDHRVIDGALAARFTKKVCQLLSSPTELLLEI